MKEKYYLELMTSDWQCFIKRWKSIKNAFKTTHPKKQ